MRKSEASAAAPREQKESKTFGVLQRVGRSFMFPIALLPVAGLLLGLGSSFTNETTLAAYGLTKILGPGTILYNILSIMKDTGNIVFANLPLIFAMGVALGMANHEKAAATLSAAIAYFVMLQTISTLLGITGGLEEGAMQEGTVAEVLGIPTLEMGVFGGIITGLGVAWLHNRFYKIQLPAVLSFFGGTRFIPIISSLAYILVGVIMFFVWPIIQNWIYALGGLVLGSGYFARQDYNAKQGKGKKDGTDLAAAIVDGLGGRENVKNLDSCATRLRVTVDNSELVDDQLLKQTGALGIIRKGNGIQVVYGPKVTSIKSDVEEYLDGQ